MKKIVGYTENAKYACLEDLELANEHYGVNPIRLCYCGREDCVPNYTFGPYVRDNYVLHFIVNGKGTYICNGKTYHLQKGQAFLIYPSEDTIYRADEAEPWSYMWVGFNGYRAEEYAMNMGFSHENPTIIVKQLEGAKLCVTNMLKAKQLTRVNELRRMSELLQMFALVMEDNVDNLDEKQMDYPSTVYVKCAMDYMARNYLHKIKIDELADNIGISRSHLTGSFKKELKISPQEYLMQIRMEKAVTMLKQSTDPINVISAACGYEDSLSFSKVFKQKFNMSPKAFRNSEVGLININEKGGYTSTTPL